MYRKPLTNYCYTYRKLKEKEMVRQLQAPKTSESFGMSGIVCVISPRQ